MPPLLPSWQRDMLLTIFERGREHAKMNDGGGVADPARVEQAGSGASVSTVVVVIRDGVVFFQISGNVVHPKNPLMYFREYRTRLFLRADVASTTKARRILIIIDDVPFAKQTSSSPWEPRYTANVFTCGKSTCCRMQFSNNLRGVPPLFQFSSCCCCSGCPLCTYLQPLFSDKGKRCSKFFTYIFLQRLRSGVDSNSHIGSNVPTFQNVIFAPLMSLFTCENAKLEKEKKAPQRAKGELEYSRSPPRVPSSSITYVIRASPSLLLAVSPPSSLRDGCVRNGAMARREENENGAYLS